MGKRSNFERVERDFYPTPLSAVLPLANHLTNITKFYEPCAGNGALVSHLTGLGIECALASDIEPQAANIEPVDLFQLSHSFGLGVPITNPPWQRKILHPMIEKLLDLSGECWLLFDADWPHTKQSSELMLYCTDIVPVGRVKWIEGSKHTGKDNCCWYRFDIDCGPTIFHTR